MVHAYSVEESTSWRTGSGTMLACSRRVGISHTLPTVAVNGEVDVSLDLCDTCFGKRLGKSSCARARDAAEEGGSV